jgi:hypothetical protein
MAKQYVWGLLLAAALGGALSAGAQTTKAEAAEGDTLRGWTTGGSTGINFSQVKLSNWAGGGESSISIGTLLKGEANYRMGRSLWENRANLAYGLIRQGDRDLSRFRKTDDILELRSQYNHQLNGENLFVTALADFRTQMGPGFEYTDVAGESMRSKISEFMAPAFLLTSLGATYKIPDRFTLTLAPVTGKFTFVNDAALSAEGAFGVDPGKRFRSEFGASLLSRYKKELFTNASLDSNLLLFANYETLSRIDVNWETTLMLKVNRFINTTIAAQLIYDHDIIQKTQFRNVINVGFLFQWPQDKNQP